MTEHELASKVMTFLQRHLNARPDHELATIKFEDWMKLRKILIKSNPELKS
jgi:hypothetical protein